MCLWWVAGAEVPVKVVVAEVEGYRQRFHLVSSATELTGVEMVEGFAGRFRQEDVFRDLKQRLGWEECRAWTQAPIERTSQVQWVTLSLLRLAQFRLEAEGSTDWWLRPPWNRKKDRPSVLDVERLLRRHGSEIRNLLAKWLGKEEGAAREAAAQRARQESSSYERYLLDLTERERETRRSKRIERLLRESRLFTEKSLSTLDLKRLPPKAAQQVRSLLEGGFVDRHDNVLIFGNPGSGKTHVACAIGQELIRAGRKVMFATCGLMVQDLLAAKRDLKLRGFLKKISQYHVMILDDIGYVQYSREEMEVLFALLAERYERGSVVLTSNLAFSGWETIFKDPMTTAAAIDRLVHHSVILELNVPSYRAEQAKKAGQKPSGPTDPSKEV